MISGRARTSLVAVAVATLTMLVATTAPARAETPAGVGTTASTQTLLGVHVGSLLGVDVLTDEGSAVTKDALSALASITGIRVQSGLLGIDQALGVVKASQPDGNGSQSTSLLLDGLPDNVKALLSGAGVLPLDVKALLGDATASAEGSANVADLGILSNIVNLHAVDSTLAQLSNIDLANVDRGLGVGAISLLDLKGLLDLLGIDLDQLGVNDLIAFLGKLGVPGLDALGEQLNTVKTAIQETVDKVQQTVGNLTGPVNNLVKSLLPGTSDDTLVSDLVNLAQALIDEVQNLLDDIFEGLDSLSLVNLTAIDLGASAKAANTAEASSASATCSVGGIEVANLGPIDLNPVLDLVGTIGQTLTDLLASLNLGIEKLLNLSVCGKSILGSASTGLAHNVATEGGIVKATSSASAIALSIRPGELTLPGVGRLCDLLKNCPAEGAGNLAPLAGRAVAQQNPLDLLDVLTNGLSVNVGTVQAEATHELVTAPAPTPAPTGGDEPLPRTGGDAGPALLLAAAFIPLALIALRLRRRLDRTNV